MELTEEDKRNILRAVLGNIADIADKEYQRRVWIRGEGPEVDDFDETVCNFFGDADPLLENYKNFGLTKAEYQLLTQFRDQFRIFADDNYWPGEFIDTTEWTRITEMAKEVLRVFNHKKDGAGRYLV